MNKNVYQMNQNADRPPLRICFKCKFEGTTEAQKCPRCDRPLFTERNIRVRGILMTVLGLFLSGFMSVITFFVTGLLVSAAKKPQTNARLNQEPQLFVLIYIIFGGVIAMGVVVAIAGIWQIIFGRRNVILIWTFFALIIATVFAAAVFRGLAN